MAKEPTNLHIGPSGLSDYYEWFRTAQHGDVLVYWTGDLQFDRDPQNAPDSTEEQIQVLKTLDTIATRIVKDAGDKGLALFQRRIAFGIFEYRAVRLRGPMVVSAPTPTVRVDQHGFASFALAD